MLNKRFLYLPLTCIVLSGCRTPAAPEQAASTPNEAPARNTQTVPTAATAPTGKTYRVDDPAKLAGQGAEYSAAMKKVALPPPPFTTKTLDKTRVVLETSRGPISIQLNFKAAPLHVRSFLYLAGKGFFNGTKFHRHADLLGDGTGFIIQGGDPLSKTPATEEFAGRGGPGYEIPREFNDLKHDKLVIAAARSQDPDSAGSQFYITQGPVHFLDEGYTVFGKVVGGADAALKLKQGDVIKSIRFQE